MDGIVSFLSGSPIVLALANVVAILTAIYAAYRGFRFLARFGATIYHRNVKTAIRRVLRRIYELAYWLSLDIHLFVSYLVTRFLMIGGLLLNVSIIQGSRVRTRQEFMDNPPRLPFESYETYLDFTRTVDLMFALISVALGIIVTYHVLRLFFAVTFVWRIRVRALRRQVFQKATLE